MRWHLIYAGASDEFSTKGVAGASWHSFDKREWQSGEFTLTLTHADDVPRPFGKGRVYRAIVLSSGTEVFNQTGTNWIELCTLARDFADQHHAFGR